MSTTNAAPRSATTPIRDLATGNLVSIRAWTTIREVAAASASDEIGVAVVERESDPVGVVSERDLVAAIAELVSIRDLVELLLGDHTGPPTG